MKQKYLYSLGITTLMCNIAFSGVWIVCNDDGSNPAVTVEHALSVFTEANKRRDYNKQPLRVPKESEKEIKIMLPPR